MCVCVSVCVFVCVCSISLSLFLIHTYTYTQVQFVNEAGSTSRSYVSHPPLPSSTPQVLWIGRKQVIENFIKSQPECYLSHYREIKTDRFRQVFSLAPSFHFLLCFILHLLQPVTSLNSERFLSLFTVRGSSIFPLTVTVWRINFLSLRTVRGNIFASIARLEDPRSESLHATNSDSKEV